MAEELAQPLSDVSFEVPEEREHADKDQKYFAITIGKNPTDVFSFWRNFTNLKYFMKDIYDIRVISPTKSEWTVKLKSGPSASWLAEIVDEVPGRMIAWKSIEDSEVKTEGSVWFSQAPAGLGTVVKLFMNYKIPGGKLTELATLMTGEDPENLTLTNLKRLKAYLETGVIPTTEGQSSGRDEDLEGV